MQKRLDEQVLGPDANSGGPSRMTKAMRDGGMCHTACFCRQRTHQPPGCACVLDTAAWTAAYQNLMGQNTLLNTAVPWRRKGPEHTGFALQPESCSLSY